MKDQREPDTEAVQHSLQDNQFTLLEIAREVAAMDPYAYNDSSGNDECIFCNDFYGWGSDVKNTKDHDDICTYLKACNLIKAL